MNADPFYDAKSGVRNAKRHLTNLESALAAFLESKPYASVIETNANRTEDFWKIKLTKPITEEVFDIAFDVVSNLRAALDRAGFAVGIAAGTKESLIYSSIRP
jgi:hypothetical protein